MHRDRANQIKNYLKNTQKENNVLIVQGARQVGKSTLITEELSELPHLLLNLETDQIARDEIDQTKSFKEFTLWLKTKYNFSPGDTLFIDEAQESLRLGYYVREMKEIWQKSKVILTGSSMSRLFDEKARIPVGRVTYLTVHPFSFREFLRWHDEEKLLDEAHEEKENIPDFLHNNLVKKFNEYCLCGGLPESVKSYPEIKYKSILQNIFLSQKEDFQRKEKEEHYLFVDALKGVSNHVGYPSKYSHVSSNYYQAKKIVDKLNLWHLLYEVNIQGHSTTSVVSQKRYIYDLGILKLIRNTPTPEIDFLETLNDVLRQPLGGIIENAVLLNYLSEAEATNELSAWKKNAKQPIEVDFIFDLKNKKIPVEVKASLKVRLQMVKNLIAYLKLYQQKEGLLVTLSKFQKLEIDDFEIYNIPAYFSLNYVF